MAIWFALFASVPSYAQEKVISQPSSSLKHSSEIPNFWDPHIRMDKPDLRDLKSVLILTDDDYPPFTMPGHDGAPTGFSVELAREACQLLQLSCLIQVLPFENLLEALRSGKGDLVIAALPVTHDLRDRFAVTLPYFRNPGRFITQKGNKSSVAETLKIPKGQKVAVIAGSVHEAFIRSFFSQAEIIAVPDFMELTRVVKGNQATYAFLDGVSAALWVNGNNSENCCQLTGGAYSESRYFGEGFVFIANKDRLRLRRGFDYAFQQLYTTGKYKELYLRFFPVSPY